MLLINKGIECDDMIHKNHILFVAALVVHCHWFVYLFLFTSINYTNPYREKTLLYPNPNR